MVARPPAIDEQLLATQPSHVPAELARQVANACQPLSDVKGAYVARVRRAVGADAPFVDRLAIALELSPAPTSPGEERTRQAMLTVLRDSRRSLAREAYAFWL